MGMKMIKKLIANRYVQEFGLVLLGEGGVGVWLLMLKMGVHF